MPHAPGTLSRTALRVCCVASIIAGIWPQTASAQATAPPDPFGPDAPSGSHAGSDLRVLGPYTGGWQFPLTRFDQSLPGWIQFGGQFRDRAEAQLGLGYNAIDDGYDLTQLRIGVYIQPTKWIELVGVTQDSRAFFNRVVPNAPPYQNRWDVREAYARLGSDREGWFDLVAGRQMFSFGDERVIGPSDWSNMGRTFDTVRLDIHPAGIAVSVFAASVIIALDGQVDHQLQGNNLYGVYASLTRILRNTTIEPYVLWRVAPGNVRLPENAGRGALNEVTSGIRVAGLIPRNVDYDVEMNWQTGSLGRYSIKAWAGHWNAAYTFKDTRTQPRPFIEYNYASGTPDPDGNTWRTHDQIYPSAHNKMDFADQFGWKNIKDLRWGVMEKLARRWTLAEYMNHVWLATKYDALYASSGAIAIPAHPNVDSTHVGDELDLIAEYVQNKHVTYGFGICHLFTGRFLNETTRGKDYNYPFAYVTYVF